MKRVPQLWSRRGARAATVALLGVALLGAVAIPIALKARAAQAAGCQLNSSNGA